MPRSYSVASVFDTHTHTTRGPSSFARLKVDGPPADRVFVCMEDSHVGGCLQMKVIRTVFETRPAPMRLLGLPLFFGGSGLFTQEEYLDIVVRVIQLSTPNALNLQCSLVREDLSEAELDTVRRVLCPALLACDSLVHIGIIFDSYPYRVTARFVDFIDEVFSSTPSCHSLYVSLVHELEPVSDNLVQVFRKRTAAYAVDARFHKITRIRIQSSRWNEVPGLRQLGAELSEGLRVSDFCLMFESDFFRFPGNLPEYLSLELQDLDLTLRLVEALSSPSCPVRGLSLHGEDGLPASVAKVFGDAIGSSQLEEIRLFSSLCPEVLDSLARGVSQSQIRHVWIRSWGARCDVESAVLKMLECSSLRELVLWQLSRTATTLSKHAIASILQHRGLEFCEVGDLLPPDREVYRRVCDENFARSTSELMLLLLVWVRSFTDVREVDINLFRVILTWMVMPTDTGSELDERSQCMSQVQ